jgi:nucleotide-binding universal stress UspA family protein
VTRLCSIFSHILQLVARLEFESAACQRNAERQAEVSEKRRHDSAARTSGMGLRHWLGLRFRKVLRYASHAAESVHANLTLVHAIPASGHVLPVKLDLEERLQTAKREAASLVRTGWSASLSARLDMLIEAARRLRADMLVIGRSPESGVRGRCGTSAKQWPVMFLVLC